MYQLTRMARVDLSCGSFDALSAENFVQRFPPHFHETFAIGVIESGWAQLRTRRGEWRGGPGDIIAFAPGEMHEAAAATADGYTYRMVYPSVDFMRALGVGDESIFSAAVIKDESLGRALRDAHSPLMRGNEARAAEDRLVDALRMLVRKYVARGVSSRGRDASHEAVRVARQYMESHYAQSLTLQELAELSGASVFQLIRRFRRNVGVTPFAYLAQYRVNRAQEMLTHGTGLSDVAYSCGFSDQSHMTRAFKQALGVPPGEYVRSVVRRRVTESDAK